MAVQLCADDSGNRIVFTRARARARARALAWQCHDIVHAGGRVYTKYVLAPSIGTLRLVKLASHGADKLGLANLTITMRELGGGGGAKTFRWTHGASRNRRQPPTRLLRTRAPTLATCCVLYWTPATRRHTGRAWGRASRPTTHALWHTRLVIMIADHATAVNVIV